MNKEIIDGLRDAQATCDEDGPDFVAIEAAIVALMLPGCWQPFATAPADGTSFLLGITARCNPATGHLEEQLPDGTWTRVIGEPKRWHPLLEEDLQ